MKPAFETTYQRESAALSAANIPWASAVFLVALATAGIAERLIRPQSFSLWLFFFVTNATLIALPLVFQKALLRGRRLERVTAVAWAAIIILIHLHSLVAPYSAASVGLATIAIMTGAAMLTSWSTVCQTGLVLTGLAAFTTLVAARPGSPALESAHMILAVYGSGLISIQASHFMDLHRRAIFRETTRSDGEANINRALEEFARELNSDLDDDGIADRVAALARCSLDADWVLLMQPEGEDEETRVVGGNGRLPSSIDNLKALESPKLELPFLQSEAEGIELVVDWGLPENRTKRDAWGRSILLVPLRHRNGRVGVIIAAVKADSTKLQRLVRGIAQHAAIAMANSELLDQLRKANTMKSEFLATMSHELRTPLHVIMGYTEMLRDLLASRADEEVTQILQRLAQNEMALTDLIEGTLDAHRLESGRTMVKRRRFDPRTLIEQIQSDTKWLPKTPGVEVSWSLPQPGSTMHSDPMKVKVIAKNLVGNALKFTKRGSVDVSATIDETQHKLVLTVSDSGPGIPEAEIPHIFEMFRQATPTASENSLSGVGLGLFIVREFVSQLGGSIQVRNTERGGARFEVDVPLDIDPPRLDAPEEIAVAS